jgi:hypothetical protein
LGVILANGFASDPSLQFGAPLGIAGYIPHVPSADGTGLNGSPVVERFATDQKEPHIVVCNPYPTLNAAPGT